MPTLTAVEAFEFRGVDSRSNPLNMPPGAALRCRNWVPKDAGVLELRYGFTTVTMASTASTASIHTMMPFTLYDDAGNETKYLISGAGTGTFNAFNISTEAQTTPTLKGAAFSTGLRAQGYLQGNHLHVGDGTVQKWTDGTSWRDNGLRALTDAEIANVVIVEGVHELTSTERSTVTLTQAAGGSFGTSSLGGMYFFVSLFDTSVNELGPATQFVASGRLAVTSGSQKVTVGNMPTPAVSTQVKLISRTDDGATRAYFCTNTSTSATLARSGTTVTVTATSHGLSTGDVVIMSGFTDTKYNSVFSVTVSDANTFTLTLFLSTGYASSDSGGTVKRIVKAANATASVDVTSTATATSFTVNQDWGIQASSVTDGDPGWQFYAAIYNTNGGGHVGNRIAIAGRMDNATRCNFRITGLPNLSGDDTEWNILIGRTGDGGQVPYAIQDNSGNWIYAGNADTKITITQAGIDGSAELPTRNDVIPAALNLFATVGDRVYGGQVGRPTTYRSGSQLDARQGIFVGLPEQSWASDDIDTFPTAEGLTGLFETNGEAFYGTKNAGAILSDVGGVTAWRGPWQNAGMAGARASCKTPFGDFWLSGSKELLTFDQGEPVPVSEEYEAALLSKIGDSYLTNVEMQYIRDVAKGINHILISCQDSTGTPFQVVHDFRLRDERSPYGQAYEFLYSSPLTTVFIMAKVRDANGAEQLWAGDSAGQFYQLHSGANDAGTEFAADALYLVNGGPDKPILAEYQWFGDQNVIVSEGITLDSTLDAGAATDLDQLTPAAGAAEVLPGFEHDFHYAQQREFGGKPIDHLYTRFQLTSHSADGNLDLNTVPHIPLENYGRIYLVRGLVGPELGAGR